MTVQEKNLLEDLMFNRVSSAEFLKHFTTDITKNIDYLVELLTEAHNVKRKDEIEFLIFTCHKLKIFDECLTEIFCKLILESWHIDHENIAMLLQKIKSPYSIEALYQTTFARYEYLDYDDAFALAVKCIWALGDINTPEAIIKLKLLSDSENAIIKKNALYQLDRNNIV